MTTLQGTNDRGLWLIPVIAIFVLSISLVHTLTRDGPDRITTNLIAIDDGTNPMIPVPFATQEVPGGWQHEAKFIFEGTGLPDEINLKLATAYHTYTVLESDLLSPGCKWVNQTGSKVEDNAPVTWSQGGCSRPDGPLEVKVRIQTKQPGPLYFWAHRVPKSVGVTPPSLHFTEVDGDTEFRTYAKGTVSHLIKVSNRKVIELLAAIWGPTFSPSSIWALIFLGIALLLVSTVCLSSALVLCRFLAPLSLWLGISLLYVVVTPPFHAPDEPDHFLTFANMAQVSNLAEDALRLANAGHFERIKFHAEQKFTAENLTAPLSGGWAGHVAAVNLSERSPLTDALWQVYGRFVNAGSRGAPTTPAGLVLMALRLFQAVLVGVFLSICVVSLGPVTVPFYLLALVVPALPTFGFHVSNYFTSVGEALVTGCFLAAFLGGSKRLLWSLPMLFLAVSVLPYSSAISLGAFGMWCLILPILLYYLRPQFHALSIRHQLLLVALSIAAATIGGALLATPRIYELSKLAPIFAGLPPNLPTTVARLIYVLPLMPLLLFIPEIGIQLPSMFKVKHALGQITHSVLLSVSIGWLILWQYVRLKPMTPLQNIELPSETISKAKYTWKAITLMFANLLPSHLDFYMSSSFWGGFGWLESVSPEPLLTLAILPISSGLILAMVALYKSRSPAQTGRWILVLMTLTVMIAGLAANRWDARINLHGRYLIFAYLYLIALASYGWVACKWPRIRGEFGMAYVLVIHSVALTGLLNRFFAP